MRQMFFTAAGATVQLGRELGKGGEGSVFEVAGNPALVAKIYHELPEDKKQDKLIYMARVADADLLRYAAWPQDILHVAKKGAVGGFLMARVSGRDPIHMLYTPASRRQSFPRAGWDFLLFAARNTAAAFDTLHQRGHVLGDVNQGNILVGDESRVVLIDCDSFQINADGTLHRCEVGVSHFTPPELQTLSSFDGITRTANHDNFGLALIIFHLLFGGRHPYSGVPQRADVGETLEDNIRTLRYAWARDARARLLLPPPNAIPVSMIPAAMAAQFEAAFTEAGTRGARPTAAAWVASLDALRGHLKRCAKEPRHVYPDHLPACPWCALDQRGVVYFPDPNVERVGSGLPLTTVWSNIEAVAAPPVVNIPDPTTLPVTPKPLPATLRGPVLTFVARTAIVFLAAVLAFWLSPALWIPLGLGIWVAWVTIGSSRDQALATEREQRFRALAMATVDYDKLAARVRAEAGPDKFYLKKKELAKLKTEYQELLDEAKNGPRSASGVSAPQQKQNFLAGCLIDVVTLPGLTAAKRAQLRGQGIVSAAEVNWSDVGAILGLADPLTRELLAWRKSCERRFVFNPAARLTAAQAAAVQARLAERRKVLEAALQNGAADLQKLKKTAEFKAVQLGDKLQQRARELAQAMADMRELEQLG